jgi:putative ATP-binding cassette transporter
VLILDEWAADQDPRFRRIFYRELVPELKARGITIVAVTHDDHYFDAADRRLHFEEGRMTEILPGKTA